MNKTACLILNYRSAESALKLIASLRASHHKEIEIFVVDNASNDGSVRTITEALGEDHVFPNPENLGYAGGLNFGLRQLLDRDFDFFWILTQDITVEPDSLSELHKLWPKLKNPGFLGSLTDLNGSEKVYFYRAKIDSKGKTKHGTKGRSIPEIPELRDGYGETDYVNGACVFTHRSVLQKVGLIPEQYFLYFEDCEWSLNASRLGYKNYVCYKSRVHHHREVGAFNRTAEYYCRRNSYLFRKKNGFVRAWTKPYELLKLQKLRIKYWLKKDQAMLDVIRSVYRDIKIEKFGRGSF